MTEWHRYNLKRRLVELSPITVKEFDMRIVRTVVNRGADLEMPMPSMLACLPCGSVHMQLHQFALLTGAARLSQA